MANGGGVRLELIDRLRQRGALFRQFFEFKKRGFEASCIKLGNEFAFILLKVDNN